MGRFRVKISDFGHSKIFDDIRSRTAVPTEVARGMLMLAGTVWEPHRPNNVAPEMACLDNRTNTLYGRPVDAWGLGNASFVMLCGEWPFGGPHSSGPRAPWHATVKALQKFSFGEQMRTKEWARLTVDAKDFVNRLLVLDPSDRM